MYYSYNTTRVWIPGADRQTADACTHTSFTFTERIIPNVSTRVAILGSSWEPIVQHKHQDLRAIQVGVVKLSTRRPVEQAICDADGKWFDFMFDLVIVDGLSVKTFRHFLKAHDTMTMEQTSYHGNFLGHPLAGLRHGAVCLHIAGWCPQRLIGWYTVYRRCCSAGSLHYFRMFQTTWPHAICRILLKILEKRHLFRVPKKRFCWTFSTPQVELCKDVSWLKLC